MALGAPLDRNAVIVCNPDQSRNIESAAFAEGNQRELGYQPGTIGTRLFPRRRCHSEPRGQPESGRASRVLADTDVPKTCAKHQ
jgi:hypothetical protein